MRRRSDLKVAIETHQSRTEEPKRGERSITSAVYVYLLFRFCEGVLSSTPSWSIYIQVTLILILLPFQISLFSLCTWHVGNEKKSIVARTFDLVGLRGVIKKIKFLPFPWESSHRNGKIFRWKMTWQTRDTRTCSRKDSSFLSVSLSLVSLAHRWTTIIQRRYDRTTLVCYINVRLVRRGNNIVLSKQQGKLVHGKAGHTRRDARKRPCDYLII